MKEQLRQLIFDAVRKAGLEISEEEQKKISIEYPEPTLGDYSTNAALILSKTAGKTPRELAESIALAIQSQAGEACAFEKPEVAGPGFINFRLKWDRLVKSGMEVSKNGIKKLQDKEEKILVEYFQPNIAKPLHVGHLRTAIIGDALARMLRFVGYQVETDTHMGDWGTQFGLLLLAFKKYGDTVTIEKDPINELNKLYIRINEDAEKDSAVREAGKLEFVKLEEGDQENRRIWKQFVEWSMEKFKTIDRLLDVELFIDDGKHHHWPESMYQDADKMPAVLNLLVEKQVLVESQGAKIVNLENQGLGVAVIVKSDGGTTYLLRDLATFIFRRSLGFQKQIYVVDARQSHSFKQLFAILKLVGKINDSEGVHVDYGFMTFKGAALSTRKGNIVLAEELLNQAQEKVAKIIEEKNPTLPNKKEVVRAVSIGAIKYFDLSHNRHSDIDFDWDSALSFEGNSGPYLQYTHARLMSILRKASEENWLQKDLDFGEQAAEASARTVLMMIEKFSDVVSESLVDYTPNLLANYLHELAEALNRFYHESPVLKAEGEVKYFRLHLVSAGAKALALGLTLLGITPVEEM